MHKEAHAAAMRWTSRSRIGSRMSPGFAGLPNDGQQVATDKLANLAGQRRFPAQRRIGLHRSRSGGVHPPVMGPSAQSGRSVAKYYKFSDDHNLSH
jgi:hypothetical protein